MSNYTLRIDNNSNCHEIILEKCSSLVEYFKANPWSNIIFDLSDLTFIYPDYALMILSSFKYLESLGIIIKGKLKYNDQSSAIDYLCRMNFFASLKISIPNKFKSISSNNSVIIQEYNEDNQIDVCQSILAVLRHNSDMDEDVYVSLDYCLNEILDNVLLHSEIGKGWVVAQYFKNMNSIRLMVSDYGVGIQNALNLKHNFSEEEALVKCIEPGVTNGKGQGHGLFATAKFIELNNGWLSIASANKKMDVNGFNVINVKDIPHWQGTCLYLRINTNIKVDYTQFTSRHYDYKDSVLEGLFG